MPLSHATPRKFHHQRDIQLRGYEREDGLIDIEAHMTDIKTYSFGNQDRGAIAAGEPLHDMWLRLTLSQALTIEAVEAVMDATPHTICPGVLPNFQRLVGLGVAKGFLKAAAERLGGIEGCTHLRELLQQIGTVAVQTMFSVRGHKKPSPPNPGPMRIPTALLNSCYSYNANGPLNANRETATPS